MPSNYDAEMIKTAVQTYGTDAQLMQLQEECGELIVALSHFRRGRDGAREEVLQEIGDVMLMLAQAKYILGDDNVDMACMASCEKLCTRLGIEPE